MAPVWACYQYKRHLSTTPNFFCPNRCPKIPISDCFENLKSALINQSTSNRNALGLFWTDFCERNVWETFVKPLTPPLPLYLHIHTKPLPLPLRLTKMRDHFFLSDKLVSTRYLNFGPTEWVIWTLKHIETLFYCIRGSQPFKRFPFSVNSSCSQNGHY